MIERSEPGIAGNKNGEKDVSLVSDDKDRRIEELKRQLASEKQKVQEYSKFNNSILQENFLLKNELMTLRQGHAAAPIPMMGGQMNRNVGHMPGQMHGQMRGQMQGQMHGQMHGQMGIYRNRF